MITAALKKPAGRQEVWTAIHELRSFTIQQLVKKTGVKTETIKEYLTGLRNAGFVEISGKTESASGHPGAFQRTVYELVKDNGREAPRVRKDGTPCPPTRRENMWRTMRNLEMFSATTLAVAATTEETPVMESDAADYLRHLHRAGYLAVVRQANSAQGRSTYRLIRRTGGQPPQVLRAKTVYDPNTCKIMWMDTRRIES